MQLGVGGADGGGGLGVAFHVLGCMVSNSACSLKPETVWPWYLGKTWGMTGCNRGFGPYSRVYWG